MAEYNTITSDFSRTKTSYASLSLRMSGAVSDYDVRANTGLFNVVTQGREVVIRNTGPITVKFNTVNNDPIELLSNEGINLVGMPVSNIYLSSTGGNTLVRIIIIGWN